MMNINTLFVAIVSVLAAIFFLFRPVQTQERRGNDGIPLLELFRFTMYEFDTNKLVDIANGQKALRFKDRYILYDFIFTDNSNKEIVTLSAKDGLYRGDTIVLENDVYYTKSDGLEFLSQKVVYDRKKGYARSDVDYIARLGKNVVRGNYLFYDINKAFLRSRNVRATYYIKEEN